jgi:hypothetical protein
MMCPVCVYASERSRAGSCQVLLVRVLGPHLPRRRVGRAGQVHASRGVRVRCACSRVRARVSLVGIALALGLPMTLPLPRGVQVWLRLQIWFWGAAGV